MEGRTCLRRGEATTVLRWADQRCGSGAAGLDEPGRRAEHDTRRRLMRGDDGMQLVERSGLVGIAEVLEQTAGRAVIRHQRVRLSGGGPEHRRLADVAEAGLGE